MAAPVRWMEWMSTYGGTATAGPNFSWVLADPGARADGHRSTCRRSASPSTAPSRSTPRRSRRSSRPAQRHGLRPGAVFPAFGMAEVAIAGTFPVPMAGLRTDDVDQLRARDRALRRAVRTRTRRTPAGS